MALLTVKLVSANNMCDIAPAAGCCGTQIPSKPLAYFLLDSTVGVWQTDAADMQAGKVEWNRTFTDIKCRDPESDRLEFYVVDGAHFRPDTNPNNKDNKNADPPDQHFYGMYKASVIQFERGKTEQQTLVLQTKDKRDTTYSFTMQGRFQDSNIDDARLEAQAAAPPAAAAPPPGPPVAAMAPPPGPPVAMPPPGVPPQAGVGGTVWDGVSWPPMGYPQVAGASVPPNIGPVQVIPPGTHVGISVGNGGNESTGSDVGDQSSMGMITVMSCCRIHWASLHGRVVLVNCNTTAVDPEAGADVHVFGGQFAIGENKGGQVTMH